MDTSDIESQLNKEALRKNNEELDRLCKKCCLTIGWCGLLSFLLYLVLILVIDKLIDQQP